MNDNFIYDLETFPNIFTMAVLHVESGNKWMMEISPRKNDINQIIQLCGYIQQIGGAMVGFNNEHFDYPILHLLLTTPNATHLDAFKMCQEIIEQRINHKVWANKQIVKQIDLFKIHHFDGKGVSLKLLEFNMCMESIQDLPFPPAIELTYEQMDVLISYNWNDIEATRLLFEKSRQDVDFREELSNQYDKDFTNSNETKIGEQYIIMKLEEVNPDACYIKEPGSFGRGTIRQTPRPVLKLADAVFNYIKFEQPEFNRILDFFNRQVIKETKGVFENLSAHIQGFDYDFGVGGIHGSIESQTVYSDDQKIIIDIDVKSYYPNIGIVNRIYPEHLGELFCDVYQDVYEMRKRFEKGTRENRLLKFALNGTYGKSNSVWSPMYDPLYTMKITINGQLMLCMLAEQLIKIPGLEMIQINTDGLTVRCPIGGLLQLQMVRKWWEKMTCLELEHAVYKRMFIRDVNNYVAEPYEGKLKRKGDYEYELELNQNFSQLIVPKVAEEALILNYDIKTTVERWPNIYDFFLRAKVGRADRLELDGVQVQRISRYYVANVGGTLIKHSPPKKGFRIGDWKKANGVHDSDYFAWNAAHPGDVPHNPQLHTKNMSTYVNRETAICKGYKVVLCNESTAIDQSNINFDYYINEVNKIVQPVRG